MRRSDRTTEGPPTLEMGRMVGNLTHYDWTRSYEHNYRHVPDPVEVEVPAFPGSWSFCGLQVDSPLGIPAGPLLNGRWILYYASLGFDILTYKTVRSRELGCYPLPNLLPVRCSQLSGEEEQVPATPNMSGTWAVSFGMPSRKPKAWRADVERTRALLPEKKRLVVSVVGSMQEGWKIDDLAADYALCARWAVESGADAVETNFSCPNVCSRDGQLYQEPEAIQEVASQVRHAVGRVPYLIKIGHVPDQESAEQLLQAVSSSVDGLVMTNGLAAKVSTARGQLLFDGQRRGICGDGTRETSLRQISSFERLMRKGNSRLHLIGVGGIGKPEHVQKYLEAGAEAVMIATAAMVDPGVALKIRQAFLSPQR